MVYDDIVESINSGKFEIFETNPFITINKNLNNFNKYQMSVSLSNGDISRFEEQIFPVIKNEFTNGVYNKIISKLFDTRKFDYIDFRGSGLSLDFLKIGDIRKIYDLTMNCKEEYTDIISSGSMVSVLGDLSQFMPYAYNQSSASSGGVYKCGTISGLNVWIDPYMRYDDTRIVLFKSVEVNIDKITSLIQSQHTFTPSLLIECDLSYDVGDSKLIFVIDRESSTGFQAFKSLQRSIKIDDILDEKK